LIFQVGYKNPLLLAIVVCGRFDPDTMPDPMLLKIATSQADEAENADLFTLATSQEMNSRSTGGTAGARC
jgi:hypothetical protein